MTTYYRRVRRKYGKPTTMKQSRIVYEPVAEPLLTRAEWEASIEPCQHQHITAIRELYRNGEFEGFDYDECEISGRGKR